MPELPEVETVRRAMAGAMIDRTVQSVQVRRYDLRVPIPQDIGQSLSGRKVVALLRRGKYMIMRLDHGRGTIIHLGMSGRVRIYPAGDKDAPLKHEHIILTLDNDVRVAYEDPRRFGMFYTAEHDDWRMDKPFAAMGAEPLEKDWSAEDLLQKLKNKKSPIKTALLDQHVVAGLGNIYVCEALHDARISPLRSSHTITRKEAQRLVPCVRAVLEDAIASGGSSLKDYKHTDGSLGYFQHKFKTYDQEGKECPTKSCKGEIMRIVQSGRSTFYCPMCQK